MAKEWDEVALWALAETLVERMDAIRAEGVQRAKQKQRELDLGPGGNVVDFASRRLRGGARRVQRTIPFSASRDQQGAATRPKA